MIPEKLYIPTSTLNFNNIMSSESISPVAFYTNRRFGYKRFEKVEPNRLDNLLLLYDKYPIFEINDKELENYPLVIEIDTRFISEECVQENKDVFFTTKTIYLNPFSTRIIFRTEAERTASLSKAEPSIESKLISLYQGKFVVLSSDIERFYWQPINIDDNSDYDNNAVSFDIIINKLKGMMYGYLLGANNSSSKEVVSLKRNTKELRNVLSAILASPDGRPTQYQNQQLNNLYTEINRDFYTVSGAKSRIDNIIAEKIEKYKTPNFLDIFKDEGFYQEWLKKQILHLGLRYHEIDPFPYYLLAKSTDKIVELGKYIEDIEKNISVYDTKHKLDVSEFPIVQNCRIIDIPNQKDFLSILFTAYKDEVWTKAEFLSSRFNFAKTGGMLLREKMGDKWDTSVVRNYINSLLKNLNEYTEFEINSIDSDVLKSFAAFCQKGEGDIDKLEDYLISNGIGDFRIAFALWGLVFGYAEMPKTLTNDLFENEDEQYVSKCYKYIHKQLHSIELDDVSNRILKNEDLGRKKIDVANKVEYFGKNKIGKQSQEIDNSIEHRVTSIPEELKLMFASEPFKKLSLPIQDYFKKESLALYQGIVDKSYIEALKKLQYPHSKNGWKTNWKDAIKVLTPKQKKVMKRNKLSQTMSLFSSESTGKFLDDYDFLRNNEEFRNILRNIKGWEKDLEWFIRAHNPNHEDYKYYKDKPIDNESVIMQFVRFKEGKYKNTEGFLKKIYLK